MHFIIQNSFRMIIMVLLVQCELKCQFVLSRVVWVMSFVPTMYKYSVIMLKIRGCTAHDHFLSLPFQTGTCISKWPFMVNQYVYKNQSCCQLYYLILLLLLLMFRLFYCI